KASNAFWLASALLSPVNTALRYGASELGISRPFRMLQNNLIAWFVTAYIHRIGTYLIEVNSGRMRIGATRYREIRESADGGTEKSESAEGENAGQFHDLLPSRVAVPIQLTVLGQAKTGKSSLINALLGEQRAVADVVVGTNAITTYNLKSQGNPGEL